MVDVKLQKRPKKVQGHRSSLYYGYKEDYLQVVFQDPTQTDYGTIIVTEGGVSFTQGEYVPLEDVEAEIGDTLREYKGILTVLETESEEPGMIQTEYETVRDNVFPVIRDDVFPVTERGISTHREL